jgi:hypothetical protein
MNKRVDRPDRFLVYVPGVGDKAVYGRSGSHAYPITLADARRGCQKTQWNKQGKIYELVPVKPRKAVRKSRRSRHCLNKQACSDS